MASIDPLQMMCHLLSMGSLAWEKSVLIVGRPQTVICFYRLIWQLFSLSSVIGDKRLEKTMNSIKMICIAPIIWWLEIRGMQYFTLLGPFTLIQDNYSVHWSHAATHKQTFQFHQLHGLKQLQSDCCLSLMSRFDSRVLIADTPPGPAQRSSV